MQRLSSFSASRLRQSPSLGTTRYGMFARWPGGFKLFLDSSLVPLAVSNGQIGTPDCSLQCHCRFVFRAYPDAIGRRRKEEGKEGRKDAAAAVLRPSVRPSVVEERHANGTGMDGSQTSTSLSSSMAMFPFYPLFLSLSLPPLVRSFSSPLPPEHEPRHLALGCKGHPWETAPR